MIFVAQHISLYIYVVFFFNPLTPKSDKNLISPSSITPGPNIKVRRINPLTPRSDQHITSPYNIHTLSNKQVVRLFKLIRYDSILIEHQILATILQGNV